MENIKKKLSNLEVFTFGAGDLFGGGAQLVISFFYLKFLTDIVGFEPWIGGTVVLISRIWDAISDPVMGVITDNTRTKYGRRKPFLLAGFFGIIVAFTWLWTPMNFDSSVATFIYVLAAYMFFSTISTIVMVPYASMSTEISVDYDERSKVNGTRLFFSQVSSLLGAVLPMVIVGFFSDVITGYFWMGLVFGLFYAIPFLVIFFICEERIPMPKEKTSFSFKTFAAPFKVRTFRILVFMYLFSFFVMDIISAAFQYYLEDYLGRPDDLEMVLGAMLITQIVLIPVVVMLSGKIGKSKTFMYSAIIWIFGSILLGLYSPEWASWMIYVIAVIVGSGLIGCIVIPWTMFPDTTDVGELAFGTRNTGSFAGIMTFMRKTSSALGIFVLGIVLQLSGYIKPEIVDGKKIFAEQPESLIWALRGVVFIIPIVLLVIVIFLTKKYPLSREMHSRLNNYLEFKRGNTDSTDVSEEELEEIKKILI